MSMLTLNGNQTVSLMALVQPDNAYNVTTSITIAPNSTVHIVDDLIAQDEIVTSAIVKQKLEFFIQENSTLHYSLALVPNNLNQATFTATIYDKKLIFRLVGANAHAQANGRCFTNGTNIIKFKTLQDHQVADTSSNLLIKGVLDDSARFTCNSMIKVSKDAQRTNALQANKNIVLSKQARAVSIPQLEIETNDVSCKHGAAVSNISDEHLFYLQSRGITLPEARKLVIAGFLSN